MGHCQSCTMPLNDETQGALEGICNCCLDEEGKLREEEEVRQGIASWFMGWQKGITPEIAYERAGHFMAAMPAWAKQ